MRIELPKVHLWTKTLQRGTAKIGICAFDSRGHYFLTSQDQSNDRVATALYRIPVDDADSSRPVADYGQGSDLPNGWGLSYYAPTGR